MHHIDSTTTARWRTGSQGDYNDNPIPDNGYILDLDRIVTLASVSGTSIVLDSPWAGPSGAYKFDSAGIISFSFCVINLYNEWINVFLSHFLESFKFKLYDLQQFGLQKFPYT